MLTDGVYSKSFLVNDDVSFLNCNLVVIEHIHYSHSMKIGTFTFTVGTV